MAFDKFVQIGNPVSHARPERRDALQAIGVHSTLVLLTQSSHALQVAQHLRCGMAKWLVRAALLDDESTLIGDLGEVLLQQALYEAFSPQKVLAAVLCRGSYIHA
jgi:predicted HD phosphohydrolase